MATPHHGKWQAARHRIEGYFYLGLFETEAEAIHAEQCFDELYPPKHQNRLKKTG